MRRISLLCTPGIMPEMTSTEGLGVSGHPSHTYQILSNVLSQRRTYPLMGVSSQNPLQIQEFYPDSSLRSKQGADYYVEASHCLHIAVLKGAEIVLTPEAA